MHNATSVSPSGSSVDNISTDLLTVKQAQGYLKCSQGFLWKKRKEGLIHSINAGKKVLIIKASIDRYLNLDQKMEVLNG